jgi:hypothetical protein
VNTKETLEFARPDRIAGVADSLRIAGFVVIAINQAIGEPCEQL